jgi:acetamidase/formamidase
MQIFPREHIHNHCPGQEWPEFLGRVQLGESFVIETERFNLANGPLAVEGIQAGDALAVHIEQIEIIPPYFAPNGGPFFEGMGDPVALVYDDGWFIYPNGLRLRARPSAGNIAVLPTRTEAILDLARRDPGKRGWRRVVNDPRGKHCHQDCRYMTAGTIFHIKAQVEEAGLCAADVHAYIGQGELAFAGIEVGARLQLRVERSEGWLVDWPLIETDDEIMLFCSDTNLLEGSDDQTYVDVVREAYRAMRAVVAARTGGRIEDANPIVATALDIRNCALYGLGDFIQKDGKSGQPDRDIAVVACLPKEIFSSREGT